jgi:uncharacterized membrane protein YozB (DUF420 family)
MVSFLESTISLCVESVVLVLLITGYLMKRQKKYRTHALTMLSALILHIISILIVMIPSLAAFFGGPGAINFADALVITALTHVSAGLLAALLGIWLVTSWHLQTNLQTCFKKKRVMDATITLWLIAFFLGIYLYLIVTQII